MITTVFLYIADYNCQTCAFQGLCKLGALGGTDASIQSMAKGSTVILTKACRRLLLGHSRPEGDTQPDEAASVDFARNGPLDAANSTRWAVDGLAFLSLSGEVKATIIEDNEFLSALYKIAEVRPWVVLSHLFLLSDN